MAVEGSPSMLQSTDRMAKWSLITSPVASRLCSLLASFLNLLMTAPLWAY